ncbi:uncharacterized protein IL334_005146 [Kwoniella shivajii]|uniref:Zn(2)-C6 fungal-type domain-containing protein n=1 Tax=Kwoniella shivajii TaxID=564305 RepID=A0ABZ1D2B9_9TREE|nr:hypothetical protein IL334_005146 [Kwoniella shivajii]
MPSVSQAQSRTVIRSKGGCSRCRQSRIKCDEVHPICRRCQDRSQICDWPDPGSMSRKHRNPRLPTRCLSSELESSCKPCLDRGEVCRRGVMGSEPAASVDELAASESSFTCEIAPLPPTIPTNSDFPTMIPQLFTTDNHPPVQSSLSTILPQSEVGELKELVRLYFRTVHHFGYLSFIHEADYWELEERQRAPEGLTYLMAAHAVRFSGQPVDPSHLQIADRWVTEIGDRLLPRVMTEFGAIELMEAVLCQTYDFLNGRYSRGMVMAGMAVRMMSFLRLHELDEWPRQSTKPLLSREGLRRLAWSVWFLDATLDGGVFGASNIHDDGFTIQLPCDDRPFLLHRQVITERLVPTIGTPTAASEPLDLSGHLLRAMCARNALAVAYSRIRRQLITHGSVDQMARLAEEKATNLLASLTPDLSYSRALYHIYRDRRPALVLLHVMRNNCVRHASLLRMLVAQTDSTSPYDSSRERRVLISTAKDLSQIVADASEYSVALDPQIAMHAYNAVEILLFQPTRLAMESSAAEIISREDVLTASRPLIKIIRELSSVCPLVSLIYPEAVNRMVQMGYVEDLTNDDILAVLQKVHCITNAEQEFDWSESFWRYEIFLSRRSRVVTSAIQDQDTAEAIIGQLAESPEDALLEVPAMVGPSMTSNMSPTLASNIIVGSPRPSPELSRNKLSRLDLPTTNLLASPDCAMQTVRTESDSSSDPISRLQNLFATRRPDSNTATPAVYVAISELSEGRTEGWQPAVSSNAGNLQTSLATDDLNNMFLDTYFSPQLALDGTSLPFTWK